MLHGIICRLVYGREHLRQMHERYRSYEEALDVGAARGEELKRRLDPSRDPFGAVVHAVNQRRMIGYIAEERRR